LFPEKGRILIRRGNSRGEKPLLPLKNKRWWGPQDGEEWDFRKKRGGAVDGDEPGKGGVRGDRPEG